MCGLLGLLGFRASERILQANSASFLTARFFVRASTRFQALHGCGRVVGSLQLAGAPAGNRPWCPSQGGPTCIYG